MEESGVRGEVWAASVGIVTGVIFSWLGAFRGERIGEWSWSVQVQQQVQQKRKSQAQHGLDCLVHDCAELGCAGSQ